MEISTKKSNHAVKTFLSIGIAVVVMWFLLTSLYQNRDFFNQQHLAFSPWQFGISLIPLVISNLFIPSIWCSILASSGIALSYRKAFRIQYLTHLGKYIPGRIWSYITQTHLASREQISIAETLSSNIMLTLIMNLSGIFIFFLSFLYWDIFTLPTRGLIVLLSVFLISSLFRWRILEKCINLILARFTSQQTTFRYESLQYIFLIVTATLSWSIFAIGLHIMISSFYDIHISQSIIIVGLFAISWLAGYYTFISPSGLGVQEGVLVYLLSFFFPVPISIVVALALRLWIILGDIILFLLAIALTMRDHQLQKDVHE